MSPDQAAALAFTHYGIKGTCKVLAGYDDINFRLDAESGAKYVVKLSRESSRLPLIEGQARLIRRLSHNDNSQSYPALIADLTGRDVVPLEGEFTALRLLTWLDGKFLHSVVRDENLLIAFGDFLGATVHQLQNFNEPGIRAFDSIWDLRHISRMREWLHFTEDVQLRYKLEYFILQFELFTAPLLRKCRTGIIHGDANDHNILCKGENGELQFSMIDFGDCCWSHPVCELAVALPYLMSPDPLAAVVAVTKGFHSKFPLLDAEIRALYHLVAVRVAGSLIMSSKTSAERPDNEYLDLHQQLMRELIDELLQIGPVQFEKKIREAIALRGSPEPDIFDLKTRRKKHLGQGLSLSYNKPIHMVAAAYQYMYDSSGKSYLDCVNNIMHVGYGHPHVVTAIQRQAAQLNTNTRYLLDQLDEYAERLTALFPAPLNRVYFVNSGSAATDLALRLAKNYTGRKKIIAVNHGYHGNTSASLEVSAYKYKSRGGTGKSDKVFEAPIPDTFRGPYSGKDADKKYAEEVLKLIAESHSNAQNSTAGPAAFICESIIGCGGQVVLPDGYLQAAYAAIRAAGGLAIADEVQTGFYRVGTHWWAFEQQKVVPDICILGKPMGNGHPLAAVITTDEISKAFDNGMEFFSSFGGNPVSCAAGLAVLDVIEQEQLGAHALRTGNKLKEMLGRIQSKHSEIGEIRGSGLFLGIDIVSNKETNNPDGDRASQLVNMIRENGVLLSTDGPHHNVIKFKPPMCFSEANGTQLCEQIDRALSASKR